MWVSTILPQTLHLSGAHACFVRSNHFYSLLIQYTRGGSIQGFLQLVEKKILKSWKCCLSLFCYMVLFTVTVFFNNNDKSHCGELLLVFYHNTLFLDVSLLLFLYVKRDKVSKWQHYDVSTELTWYKIVKVATLALYWCHIVMLVLYWQGTNLAKLWH